MDGDEGRKAKKTPRVLVPGGSNKNSIPTVCYTRSVGMICKRFDEKPRKNAKSSLTTTLTGTT